MTSRVLGEVVWDGVEREAGAISTYRLSGPYWGLEFDFQIGSHLTALSQGET